MQLEIILIYFLYLYTEISVVLTTHQRNISLQQMEILQETITKCRVVERSSNEYIYKTLPYQRLREHK